MSEEKLKLIKAKKRRAVEAHKADGKQTNASESRKQLPPITEAEAAEIARFKALTAVRAARQAMVRRIIAELEELDKALPAA